MINIVQIRLTDSRNQLENQKGAQCVYHIFSFSSYR